MDINSNINSGTTPQIHQWINDSHSLRPIFTL